MFLSSEDFKVLIKEGISSQVVDGENAILDEAQLMAQSEAESYLRHRYDVAAIFSTTGDSRSKVMVMRLTDMALYHVHARINPTRLPQIRIDRYEAAIKWLEMIANGNLTPDFPLLSESEDVDPTQTNGKSKVGSNPKLGHQW